MILNMKVAGYTLLDCVLAITLFSCVLMYLPHSESIRRTVMKKIEQEQRWMQQFERIYFHMRRPVSMAGHLGCASVKSEPRLTIHGLIPHSGMMYAGPYTVFRAQGEGWYPPLPAILQGKVAEGIDALRVEYAGPWHRALNAPMLSVQGLVPLPVRTEPSGWFVISDCTHADIFEGEWVTQGPVQGILPRTPLSTLYDERAWVSPWQVSALYLHHDHETQNYSLVHKDLLPGAAMEAWVSGIRHWHLSVSNGILQVDVLGPDETLTVWMAFDHAR